jgi:hypothetical protein
VEVVEVRYGGVLVTLVVKGRALDRDRRGGSSRHPEL